MNYKINEDSRISFINEGPILELTEVLKSRKFVKKSYEVLDYVCVFLVLCLLIACFDESSVSCSFDLLHPQSIQENNSFDSDKKHSNNHPFLLKIPPFLLF